MKNTSHRPHPSIIALCILGLGTLLVIAWNPTSQSFNGNQFSNPQFTINVKDGAPFTNTTIWTSLTVNSTNPGSFFGGAVVATNGFEMPSNAIPALVLTAGKAYFTNMLANFVLASFAGVPADQVWSIYLLATNGSGGNLTVTGPNGAVAAGQGKPPVFTVTNGNWAEFQFNGWGQVLTNMNWTPHY